MRITKQEQENRKNRMLHVAYKLFCKNGIESVTVAQLAKTAGVSPNSIFRYFNTKAELVCYAQIILWKEIVLYILSNSKDQRAATKRGLDEVKILLFDFKSLYITHREYLLFSCDYKLFLMRNGIKLPQQLHEKMMEPLRQALLSALDRGQADGSVSKNQTSMSQYWIIWSVMRGFVDGAALHGCVYEGYNPWEDHFDLAAGCVACMLKGE